MMLDASAEVAGSLICLIGVDCALPCGRSSVRLNVSHDIVAISDAASRLTLSNASL